MISICGSPKPGGGERVFRYEYSKPYLFDFAGIGGDLLPGELAESSISAASTNTGVGGTITHVIGQLMESAIPVEVSMSGTPHILIQPESDVYDVPPLTLDSANTGARGLWANSETIWVADHSDYKIYAYDSATKERKSSEDFNTLSAAGNNNPSALWSDGTTMWVADNDDSDIRAYNLTTKARDSDKDISANATRGIWSDGTTMWVQNGRYALRGYTLADGSRDTSKDITTSLNDTETGVYSDGTTIWAVDTSGADAYVLAGGARDSAKDIARTGHDNVEDMGHDGTGMVFVYGTRIDRLYDIGTELSCSATLTHGFDAVASLHSATPPLTLDSANDRPRGVWSNSETVWVSDESDDKLFAYDAITKERKPQEDFNTLSAAGNDQPRGIWSDGTTMWVVERDDSYDRVYAYNLSTKARDPNKDLPTPDAYLTGIWSDGTTAWVVDDYRNRVYAFTLSTVARDTTEDFDLHSDNGNPTGIWSDGTTIWVVDYNDNKAYAYNMSTKARDSAKDISTGSNPEGLGQDGTSMVILYNRTDIDYTTTPVIAELSGSITLTT